MAQSLNLGVALGSAKTGLTIGYRIDNLDGSNSTAFTTTNVVESTITGTYYVSVPVGVPDAGGVIVWGESGTDYWTDIIDRAPLTAIEIADAILSRGVVNVEGTADEFSLTAIILALLSSTSTSTTWTIKKSDGSTTFATRTLTESETALPVVGVS